MCDGGGGSPKYIQQSHKKDRESYTFCYVYVLQLCYHRKSNAAMSEFSDSIYANGIYYVCSCHPVVDG